MISSLLLAYRESLEAVLIVGIILMTLTRQNKQSLKKYVIIGAGLGVLISLLGGGALFLSAQGLEEETMELIEGVMMLLASGLIAYFVVWMANQNKGISASISQSVSTLSTGFSLALLAFLGVFREGLELVIFTLANLSAQTVDIASGTVIGILLAIVSGLIIFKSTFKLNLNWIFNALALVLIFIGAELIEEGLIKLIPSTSVYEDLVFYGYNIVALVIFFRQDLKKLIVKAS